MPDPSQLPAPILDPSQYPAYLDAMRKQQLAQALMQNTLQSTQTPQGWDSMRIVPRRSALSGVTTLASALMAGKAQKQSQLAMQNYYQGLMGGNRPTPSTAAPPSAPQSGPAALTQEMPPSATGTGSAPTPGIVAPAPQQTPTPRPAAGGSVTGGMSPQDAQRDWMIAQANPEYFKAVIAPQLTPTDGERIVRAAGFDPASGQGQQIMRMIAVKAGNIPLVAGRKGAPMFDAQGNVVAFSPEVPEGAQPIFARNVAGVTQATSVSDIPGAMQSIADASEAKQRGTAAGTPTIVTGSSGAPIATFPAARGGAGAPVATPPQRQAPQAGFPGAPPLNPAPGNHIMSPTEAKANESLATQAVTNFQALNEKATAATAALRNTSEMRNLLQGFNPGKAAGALAGIGNVAISLGMDPQKVASLTQVDPGNVEAFEKNTAALASEVVKEFTNRTTQMEFSTFMRNNPNPLMSANGLKRVLDFMDKGLNSTVDQQQEAQVFWKANQTRPERFVTDFPAYYNAKKAGDIKAGKFDSVNPSMSSIQTRSDVQAAAKAQGAAVNVNKGDDIEALKRAHPPGTVFTFPDGSKGKL